MIHYDDWDLHKKINFQLPTALIFFFCILMLPPNLNICNKNILNFEKNLF